MINRTIAQIDILISDINREWKLSLNEEEFLEDTLNLILRGESDNPQKFLDFYLSEDWSEILEIIPDWHIQHYAERQLGMGYEECDECLEKHLCEFDDDDLLDEVASRGLSNNNLEYTDIVSENQFEEMIELFDKLSFSEREELLNKIR